MNSKVMISKVARKLVALASKLAGNDPSLVKKLRALVNAHGHVTVKKALDEAIGSTTSKITTRMVRSEAKKIFHDVEVLANYGGKAPRLSIYAEYGYAVFDFDGTGRYMQKYDAKGQDINYGNGMTASHRRREGIQVNFDEPSLAWTMNMTVEDLKAFLVDKIKAYFEAIKWNQPAK